MRGYAQALFLNQLGNAGSSKKEANLDFKAIQLKVLSLVLVQLLLNLHLHLHLHLQLPFKSQREQSQSP